MNELKCWWDSINYNHNYRFFIVNLVMKTLLSLLLLLGSSSKALSFNITSNSTCPVVQEKIEEVEHAYNG